MRKRSDKYKEIDESLPKRRTRTNKNKHLYASSSSIEVSSFDNAPDIFKSNDEVRINSKVISFEDLKKLANEEKPVYDINKHIAKAKETRALTEEEIKKEKKNEEYYNVLSNLNKKYINQKTMELEELVKDVAESVKDEETLEETMLKALMKTSNIDKVSEDAEETLEKTIEKKEPETMEDAKVYVEGGKFVNSFYTRSMDLTDKDFASPRERPKSKLVLFLIICIIIILIIIGVLVVLNYM